MSAWLDLASAQFQVGLLIFVRFAALLTATPLIGGHGVPRVVRLGLSALIAMLLTPVAPHGVVQGPAFMMVALAKEVLVGLMLGWIATVLFASVQIAGEWLDLHGGFQAAHLYNPAFESSNSLVGSLKQMLAGLVFLGSGGYAMMLRAAAGSLAVSPPGVLALDLGTDGSWTTLVARMTWIAVQLAAPVAATLFLVEIALAFAHRALPQVNLFILALPVKAWITLAAVALSIPAIARVLENLFALRAGSWLLAPGSW